MMVRTATHSYIFELKVVATDWRVLEQARREGVQYKVTFRYPNSTEFVAEADTAPELDTALASDRVYNFDYDYSARRKSAWLVPVNVYDDGQFTYIRMSDLKNIPTGNFPAVFAREREGSDDYRSEEHTSELQSLLRISYAVFCLKKKRHRYTRTY